ncbi:MAG: DegT/DnrJ/EryC1/StrS family aminotransferase, partial [Vicinamibacterales bacterium]
MSTRYPKSPEPISMADSDIGPSEVSLVNDVLRSRALSCGPMIDRFEHEWAERLGVRHAVAVSSGTAGLHLAMIAAGVSAHDLVVTTPYSFVASANVILYQRAVPVFVDIDPVTLNLDVALAAEAVDDLAAGRASARRWLPREGAIGVRRVKALLPVHVFGRPVTMGPLLDAARRHRASVIEDACEAVGAEHHGQAAGTFGDAAVFGFFPNKQIAMGEGGVITTNSEEWAALFRSLRNQGRHAGGAWLEYSRLGYNYRLNDMSAALGLAQLRRVDELLARRAAVAAAYSEQLALDGVSPIAPTPGTTRMSWFVYVVRFAEDIDRDLVMRELQARGIPSRPYFPCIHLQPFYRERFGFSDGDFPHAEAASLATLALPFHANMPLSHVEFVAGAVREIVGRVRGSASMRDAVAVPASRRPAPPEPHTPPGTRGADEALIDAFLSRPAMHLPMDDIRGLVGGRRVLVTGAGGSIGSELCRQIAVCGPASLVMLDRYENGLHGVAEELSWLTCARPVIADITDAARLDAVMRETRPEIVLHAAAHKHVPLMEDNPGEAIKNNVTGTRLVVDAAVGAGAMQFVLISTDKAVRPSSVMGATKRLAELIVQRAAEQSATRCVSVRFGNVIGSNGSVFHTFLGQVRAGGPVTVTDPGMRRYFMRISEAAQLVLHAASGAPSGSIAVLD